MKPLQIKKKRNEILNHHGNRDKRLTLLLEIALLINPSLFLEIVINRKGNHQYMLCKLVLSNTFSLSISSLYYFEHKPDGHIFHYSYSVLNNQYSKLINTLTRKIYLNLTNKSDVYKFEDNNLILQSRKEIVNETKYIL
jgi:hypothetical protein